MNGTITYGIDLEKTSDTMVCATGPISLSSTGEKVGTLQLLFSADVRLFDNDGKIIKKTGDK